MHTYIYIYIYTHIHNEFETLEMTAHVSGSQMLEDVTGMTLIISSAIILATSYNDNVSTIVDYKL